MVKLMDQTLFLHRQQSPARTPQEQTSLSSQIAATDSQIDRLVYDLYGLTGDEIMNGSVPHFDPWIKAMARNLKFAVFYRDPQPKLRN